MKAAEQLMADAVGAEHAFFSTCGSSLSVKAAMLAVAGHEGDLLPSRDAHKSVVAGLIFSGLRPRWVRPRWDPELHLAHPPSPERVAEAWDRYPRAAAALIVSPTPYGTCADIEGIARVCHARGRPLIVDEARSPGTGSRTRCGVGRVAAAPHSRSSRARYGDPSLRRLIRFRGDRPGAGPVGRIAAEQITPYPPGIPVLVPGERINRAVIDYLLSGLKAGMVQPDPADPTLATMRVMAEQTTRATEP